MLVAFLISFLAIRTSARLTRSVSWWPGGVKSGDVHIHHLVWGICLMMFSGFLAFAMPLEAPWWHIFAIGFGVGVGFTLDEFALWVRLKDVYWSEEGCTSLDAVVVAAAFAALVVLGTNPFGLDDPASISGTAVAVTVILGLAVTCFLKGACCSASSGCSSRSSRSLEQSGWRIRRRPGRVGAITTNASMRPACALTQPDGPAAGSAASATWSRARPLRNRRPPLHRTRPPTTIRSRTYRGSVRGSPNCASRLRSPNHVIADTWSSTSVSTIRPYARNTAA